MASRDERNFLEKQNAALKKDVEYFRNIASRQSDSKHNQNVKMEQMVKKLSTQTTKLVQAEKELAEYRRQLERLTEDRDVKKIKIKRDEVKFIKDKVKVENELKITLPGKEKVKRRVV